MSYLFRRAIFVLLVGTLFGIFPAQPSESAPQAQNIIGYYYLLNGFSGNCISGGGANVAVSGDFSRIAYLPAVNSHTATFSNPASVSTFSTGAIGTAQNGAVGTFYSGYLSTSGPAPVTVTATIDSTANGAVIGSSSITVTCNAVGAAPVVQTSHTYAISAPVIQDGRLNTDLAAPVIVYQGSIRLFVLNPNTNTGIQILTVSDARIDEVGVPSVATVLASTQHPYSGQPIKVYRLPNGEFQLNTAYRDGKPYIFGWNEDATVRYYLAR